MPDTQNASNPGFTLGRFSIGVNGINLSVFLRDAHVNWAEIAETRRLDYWDEGDFRINWRRKVPKPPWNSGEIADNSSHANRDYGCAIAHAVFTPPPWVGENGPFLAAFRARGRVSLHPVERLAISVRA